MDIHVGVDSEPSWVNLLFSVEYDDYDGDNWTKPYLTEACKTFDMLFAHGIDPNQSHRGSTVWEQFLTRALGGRFLWNKDYFSFFLGVTKSFLRYGADTQGRIRYNVNGSLAPNIEGRTVSEVITEMLHSNQFNAATDPSSLNETLNLLQLEILEVEAHDAYREKILNATQDEHPGSFENHDASLIQAFPTPANRDDYARPGYGESNRMETLRGARDVMRIKQASSFRRSQVHSGGRTCILDNPKVSRHSDLPPRSVNA
jgi:hypothetical protein